MEQYPTISGGADVKELAKSASIIQRMRQDDIGDFDNLVNRFMRGRLVGKIPTASNDVDDTDRLGDFSFALDAAFVYFFVDNAGTPEWRRITMASF